MQLNDTTETRAVKLVDFPLIKRLTENGAVLDSEARFTRESAGVHGASFFNLLLPQRTIQTLVARLDKQHVIGQFRLRPDENHAHIVYIAPDLSDETESDTVWLHILDAMAIEAGKRGAHTLSGEVGEEERLFKTMRHAGYAIYARQEIWRRMPGDALPLPEKDVELTEATSADTTGIHVLYSNIVPRLVQQISDLPGDCQGLVYRKDDRIEGYIAVSEGKAGIYMMPHLHPDVFSEAADILAEAISRVSRTNKLPIFVRVRRYQDWLDEMLVELGFELQTRQAVMVKHITAGVRSGAFRSLAHSLEAVPSGAKPPGNGFIDYWRLSRVENDMISHFTSDDLEG